MLSVFAFSPCTYRHKAKLLSLKTKVSYHTRQIFLLSEVGTDKFFGSEFIYNVMYHVYVYVYVSFVGKKFRKKKFQENKIQEKKLFMNFVNDENQKFVSTVSIRSSTVFLWPVLFTFWLFSTIYGFWITEYGFLVRCTVFAERITEM